MIRSPVASPYNFVESLYWLKKYVTGISQQHAGLVENIPPSFILNEHIVPVCTLVFVGDIMPTANKCIRLSDPLKEFVRGGDYFVANLEGCIAGSPRSAMPTSDRLHDQKVLDILADIFPPERTYVSVANNHAADLGGEEFFKSVELLRSRRFNVFGYREQPFCDIGGIRITSATQWSNRKNDFLIQIEEAKEHLKKGAFNIFYPHFGYEFEAYPRPSMIDMSRRLLKNFDAVIGHHPHCPQPVCAERAPEHNQLLAYSLGNFMDIRNKDNYRQGLVLKIQCGRGPNGRWLIGQVEWRNTQCVPLPGGDFVVVNLCKGALR